MVCALRLGRGAQTMRAPSDTYVIAKRGAQTTHAHKVSARCAVHTLWPCCGPAEMILVYNALNLAHTDLPASSCSQCLGTT